MKTGPYNEERASSLVSAIASVCKGNSWSRVFWALRATFPRLAERSRAVRDPRAPASALPWPSLYLRTFISHLIMFPKHRELAQSLSMHTTTYPDAQTLRWTLPSFYIPAFRYGPSHNAPCAPSRSLVLPLQADLLPIVPTGVAGCCRVQARGHSRVWPLFVFLFISWLLILIPHRDDPVQLALSLIVSPLASGGPQFVLFGPPPPGMLYIHCSRYVFDFGPPPPAQLNRSCSVYAQNTHMTLRVPEGLVCLGTD